MPRGGTGVSGGGACRAAGERTSAVEARGGRLGESAAGEIDGDVLVREDVVHLEELAPAGVGLIGDRLADAEAKQRQPARLLQREVGGGVALWRVPRQHALAG